MKKIKKGLGAVKPAIKTLEGGGLVIFPCETVYGIACDCLNTNAVKKITKYKARPFGKPYAIMCSSKNMADEYVYLNGTAIQLYQKFLPGAVTIVSTGKHKVAKGIESESGTLGVRIPAYHFMIRLIKEFGRPIVATSANASYKKRPYKISDILENLSIKQKELIDLIIDAGTLPRREPSTVIDTTLDNPVVLRQGNIKLKNNNEILSRSEENTQNLGKELLAKYENYSGRRAIVFALQGEMGVGKTIFTKGLAKALGIKEVVTSPTFALENEYEIPNSYHQLHHYDAWRMIGPGELKALDFEDAIKNKSIVSIEWAERVADEIREFDDEVIIIWVKIRFGKRENERLISWGNI
jgi:L-threonylcarbamoyladenylate synthase